MFASTRPKPAKLDRSVAKAKLIPKLPTERIPQKRMRFFANMATEIGLIGRFDGPLASMK